MTWPYLTPNQELWKKLPEETKATLGRMERDAIAYEWLAAQIVIEKPSLCQRFREWRASRRRRENGAS